MSQRKPSKLTAAQAEAKRAKRVVVAFDDAISAIFADGVAPTSPEFEAQMKVYRKAYDDFHRAAGQFRSEADHGAS